MNQCVDCMLCSQNRCTSLTYICKWKIICCIVTLIIYIHKAMKYNYGPGVHMCIPHTCTSITMCMHSSEGRNMGIIIHYMECLIYTVMLCTIMIPFIGIEVITIHTQQPIAYPTPSLITFVPFPFLSPLSYH